MARSATVVGRTTYENSAGRSDVGDLVLEGVALILDADGNATASVVIGSESVPAGGSGEDALILNGGAQIIQSGGAATRATVGSNKAEIVSPGGVASTTVISGGTPQVQDGDVLSGLVIFASAGSLQIDSTSVALATIYGFADAGQLIDLRAVAFDSAGSAVLTDRLQVGEGGQTVHRDTTIGVPAIAASGDGAFIQLGPAPSSGLVQSRDAPPNGTVTGAVQAIVTDPADANTMWLGGPNGGVWVTHNGGVSWTPLTDKQASLSIASLSLDPTDATNNTLIAGIGLTSNGTLGSLGTNESYFAGNGGRLTGILYTTDGGATWSALGGSTLSGHSIVGVAARSQTLLAAAFEPWAFHAGSSETNSGGLFRSTNGGSTFTQVSTATGLGAGPVTSLVGAPDSTSTLYAAVTNSSSPGATAVYVSTDTGGTWTLVFGAAQSNGIISSAGHQMVARVATAAGGQIAVGLVDTVTGRLAGLFLSTNSGSSWTSLAVPAINPGGQGLINFAIALDPTTAGTVYVTGDRIASSPFTVSAFRVTTSGAVSITDGNTGDNSTTHADSRVITFDANDRLILGTDGGIYARSSPTSSGGDWTGLNGNNLSLFAPQALSFDGNSDRLAIAAQDTGVAFESSPGGAAFFPLQGGDGENATVNDVTAGNVSAIYSSSQFLGGLSRLIVDANGNPFGPTPNLSIHITADGAYNPNFWSPFVLNKIDPSLIAIGAGNVYVTQDDLSNLNASKSSDNLTLTDVGSINGSGSFAGVKNLAYGTQDNTGALLASGDSGQVWLSTAATPASGSLHALTTYTGLMPTDLAFDLRTQQRFFVVDSQNLYATINAGSTMTTLTSNLTGLNIIRPMSVQFISNNGVNALLVGGVGGVANAQSPIAVADSDSSGSLTNWRAFGNGLPNTLVGEMNYDVKADTLAVGMWGRGGWVQYDVTSNFSSATVLQFGLANNNSTPDVSLLSGSRQLVKYGTGTLTIGGAATYSGGSTINGGVIQINSGATVNSTITFSSTSGSLGLANDFGFSNTLSGLHVGTSGARTNFVDIEGHTVTISGVSGQGTSSGTITLSDGTVLHLANVSSTTWFANTVGDGSSGTDVFVSDTACYCRGTLILTDRGEVPVEDLAIGARLVTLDGTAKRLRWIGRRSYVGWLAAGNPKVMPVCFKPGSLADGVPRRELWVSPEHAIYLDGVLVPAELLVNGSSIVKAEAVDEVHYFHIELEEHDVILAEGAWAESFVDDDSRGMFHNASEFHVLYPEAGRPPAQYCAPRVEDGFELEALRRNLAGRARRLHPDGTAAPGVLQGNLEVVTHTRIGGWALDPAAPDTSVSLVVYANGAEIGRVVADRYRRDLQDAGIGDGCHAFEFSIPGGLVAASCFTITVCRGDDAVPLPGSPALLAAQAVPSLPSAA